MIDQAIADVYWDLLAVPKSPGNAAARKQALRAWLLVGLAGNGHKWFDLEIGPVLRVGMRRWTYVCNAQF